MARFYLLAVAIVVTTAPSVCGQSVEEQPVLGAVLNADTIRALPTANNPFALLDAMQVEVIGDRFVAGGLNLATPPRVGGLLSSWTQTQFRLGDISITDPRSGGTPLLSPILPFIDRVAIGTGAMNIDDDAVGLSMTLTPLRPGTTWRRTVEGFGAAGLLASSPADPAPSVDRVRRWADGNAAVSGPLTNRVGLAAAASWRGLSHVAARSPESTTDRVASGFAHLVFAATGRDELRALGWIQRATTGSLEDTSVHVQSTWERRDAARGSWRAFAGYTERKRNTPASRILVVDSLTSDPVSDYFDTGDGSSRRWSVGGRISPVVKSHQPSFGADVENARARFVSNGIEEIRELLDGLPSRLWTLRRPSGIDFRTLTRVAAFANERLTRGRLTIDGGVRLDHVNGSATAASQGISWTTWLPRVLAQWQWTRKADVAVTGSYRRSAYQLPLNILAVGDPLAPVADVARWNGLAGGQLIARVGPGTGGDPSLSQVDRGIERPVTDELVLAIRSRPFRGFEVELARIAKRESSLFSLVDTGVPGSGYLAFRVPDPSFVATTAGPFDRPSATALNRPAGTYGNDRYLLTNRTDEAAKSWAMELNVRASTERITLFAGGALTWAYGSAAAIGFLPTQNDQNVLGNAFIDANAQSDVRGQLFQDRSHVVKIAGIYRLPAQISVGAFARYQDGQPFSRVIVVPGLNQGPSLVRAYRNGGAAFTYTGTLDVRVQRTLTVGRADVTAGLDVYNVPNLRKEVSEYVVAGTRFRAPTELQPPRAALVSVRVAY